MLFALPLAACVVASVSAFISGTTILAVPQSEAFYWPCSYAVRCGARRHDHFHHHYFFDVVVFVVVAYPADYYAHPLMYSIAYHLNVLILSLIIFQ